MTAIGNTIIYREAPIRVCAEIQWGLTSSDSGRGPLFGAGRRSGGAFISSVIHHIPIPGWGQAAERRIPQCPSAERRLPQGIISPPCQTPCSRRYPYACHVPKGLGRGVPEGKGYATTSVRSGLGGASMISTLVTHMGFPCVGTPASPEQASGLIAMRARATLPTALNRPSG